MLRLAVPLEVAGRTHHEVCPYRRVNTSPLAQATSPLRVTMSGSSNFGIVVYGYGEYTSYMYPGGLNLETVTITPK